MEFIQESIVAFRACYTEYVSNYVIPCRQIRAVLEDQMYPDLQTLEATLGKVDSAAPTTSDLLLMAHKVHKKSLERRILHLRRDVRNLRRILSNLAATFPAYEQDIHTLRESILAEIEGSPLKLPANDVSFLKSRKVVPEHKVHGIEVIPETHVFVEGDVSEENESDGESVGSEDTSEDGSDTGSDLASFVELDSEFDADDDSYDPSEMSDE